MFISTFEQLYSTWALESSKSTRLFHSHNQTKAHFFFSDGLPSSFCFFLIPSLFSMLVPRLIAAPPPLDLLPFSPLVILHEIQQLRAS